MVRSQLVTLLTDFGSIDVYVGVMKGVIAGISPEINVVDLTHEIPPQDIAAARFCWMNAYSYFPPGTVHVAVVDPGVGSQRRAVAVEIAEGFLVAPDNGLLSGILSQSPAISAIELNRPQYWRTPNPSQTFHGRDIFAPIGAHLAAGTPLSELGTPIDPATLVCLPIPGYRQTETGWVGGFQYCDRFGNLVTTIPASAIAGKVKSVRVGNYSLPFVLTYSDAQPEELVALLGSHGWLEIAANRGSAASQFPDWQHREVVIFNVSTG
ncbi:MAG TPA: SAM-dependent chlorinase/fluorinase [Oscillatoriales cyanobacterium M59_W2019_021]|nr:SAM-dependent chlorinase/fluorinase [Oscillatoriales cyanobacterium M59_W2019_021]